MQHNVILFTQMMQMDGSLEMLKLIEFNNGSQEMYHLTTDPYERTHLLDAPLTSKATAAKMALESEVAVIR